MGMSPYSNLSQVKIKLFSQEEVKLFIPPFIYHITSDKMIFEIVRTEGLAHYSYFIGSEGVGAVIDPRRDIDIYLKVAEKNDMKITHVFETHRNEDYVIGSTELMEATDSEVYHGVGLDFKYGESVNEGDSFKIGQLELEVLETPGHTDESISLVLRDKSVSNTPLMVFTGDALFAGDVGRTDLYGMEERERMANNLYHSLHDKLLKLDDGVLLCPAHGQGSVCGGNISNQVFTTIGYQRKNNPLLKIDKYEFLKEKKEEKLYRPPYFRKMEDYNKNGAPLTDKYGHLKALSKDDLKDMDTVQILDVRDPMSFSGAHVPGSLNIWKDGLPHFAGWFLNYEDPIVIIGGCSNEKIYRCLIRLGYDNVTGYLSNGFHSWHTSGERLEQIEVWSVHDLHDKIEEDFYLIDIRDIKKFEQGHIKGSHHIYAGEIQEHLEDLPNKKLVVYCDSGYKTSVVASILKTNGFQGVVNVMGGMNAWESAGYSVSR